MSSLNYSEFCRLCLVKERVSTPIFEGEGDVRRIFLKIATCLPIKVSREDHLPKSICDDCLYKVENQYQFWNTTANSEKQLHQWLGSTVGDSIDVKNINASGMDPMEMKQESMDMDQGSELSKSLSRVEAVLAEEAGRVAAAAHGEDEDEEEEESEEEGSNSEESEDDDNDADEPNKEDDDEDEAYDEELEPTTFVNVSLACDEAGPSGTQQQTSVAPSTSTSAPAASGFNQDFIKAERKDRRASLHKSKQCVCDCGQEFSSSRLLKKHLLTHRPTSVYPCDTCGEQLDCPRDLENHIRSHSASADKMSSNYVLPKLTFICDICNFSTTRKANLLKHKRLRCNKKIYKCDICDQECISRFGLKQHKAEHTDLKPYHCIFCNKTFGHKHNMQVHMKKHDPSYTPEVYQCETCGKSYSNRGAFRGHKLSHAGVKKTVVCDVCGKSVSSNETLKVHKRIHTGERPFVCDVCGKSFSAPQYFKQHKRSHTGEKPHGCDQCGKCFTQRSSLTVHKRYHTGQRPYECDICLKGFITKTLLNAHERNRHNEAA